MGAVYLAEHPLIGKSVALKVIHRELATNREVVQRFFQEAQAVNKIGNEHIVEIHDFGVTPEGDHFYIMEYLEGRTLALGARGTSRVLDVARALHIGAQIASALARRARGRRDPPRPQARQRHADVAARRSATSSSCSTSGSRRCSRRRRVGGEDRGRRVARHAAVHVARGVREPSATSITAPTSTRSACCCSR